MSRVTELQPQALHDTRLTILRTARELIQTRSYLGLSFQELADRVGVRKASLYHHFPSKEALGVAVLERSIHQFDEWSAQLGGTPQDKLRAYIGMFRDVLGAGRRVCPGGAMGPGWDCIEPSLQQAVKQIRQRQIDWLTVVVGQLKATKSKPPGAAAQIAAQLFALCQGGLLSARISGRAQDFDEALAPLMEQLHLIPKP
ncbi:MAG: TetR/AcrR family transcriptional regulator [Aquabacterium sp.]|jgi:TetR/AcrR family transcriptional repressor of nem operon|nr:TetR/AcrR family transcriptional regulator [Aquabacterium sp.]